MAKSDDKNLDYIVKCIEEASKHHDKVSADWKRMYEVYLGKPDEKRLSKRRVASDWRSRLFVKHAFQQVETLLPEFLVEDPNFEVVPRERGDEAAARTMQILLDYQLDRDHYAEKRMSAVKKAIIFGACPVKVTWSYDVKRMKVRNPMPPEERAAALMAGQDVPAYIEKDVTLSDDPTMVVVDPFDFMWDPAATCIDDARYVLHRSWLTTEQLKQREQAGVYQNVGKIGQSGGTGDGFIKRLFGESEEETQARRDGRHEVIEKWTRDRLVVVVDRKVIVRDIENPYWHRQIPFVMLTTQPDVDKMVGLSEVWSIEQLQEAYWRMQNKQYDALDLTIDPPIASEDPRLKEFDFRPGARGQFAPQTVRSLDIGQASNYLGGQEADRIMQQMERMTGINASISGNSSEGTATEAAMNLRQGKGRIALKVSNIDRGFARAADMMIQLNQQFIDAERVLRIGGEGAEWNVVSPQDIAGAFDVKARNSTDRTVKELAREQSLNLLNTFAQFAQLGYDIDPIIQKAAQAHDLPGIQKIQQPVMDPAIQQADPAAQQMAAGADGLDQNGFAPDALSG